MESSSASSFPDSLVYGILLCFLFRWGHPFALFRDGPGVSQLFENVLYIGQGDAFVQTRWIDISSGGLELGICGAPRLTLQLQRDLARDLARGPSPAIRYVPMVSPLLRWTAT